jgi:hypothetical protein
MKVFSFEVAPNANQSFDSDDVTLPVEFFTATGNNLVDKS